jgi:hypothetical protein
VFPIVVVVEEGAAAIVKSGAAPTFNVYVVVRVCVFEVPVTVTV